MSDPTAPRADRRAAEGASVAEPHRRHKGPCGPECTETPPLERWRALPAPLPGTEELTPYDPDAGEDEDKGLADDDR
jgi:hypothetical protein